MTPRVLNVSEHTTPAPTVPCMYVLHMCVYTKVVLNRVHHRILGTATQKDATQTTYILYIFIT